jgi:drug/metabolite transporter (DMT)-like permease
MTIGVLAAVLFAAMLHASWNAIIKFGDDKFQGMVLLSVAHGLIGLLMILAFPMPAPAAWPWLAASVGFHLWYKFFLSSAYERGDLSRVYPIARGFAPMLVLIISGLFLSDIISTREVIGIIAVGVGILILARGVFTQGETVALLPFALASAVGTAGYSITDGLGARASGDASGYVGWLFFLDAFLFTVWGIARRGWAVFPRSASIWGLGLVAGTASVLAYWIAVWAMTIAPIALVAALRETSVMFAVLIGILFFNEKADKGKLLASAVIIAGVMIMRL